MLCNAAALLGRVRKSESDWTRDLPNKVTGVMDARGMGVLGTRVQGLGFVRAVSWALVWDYATVYPGVIGHI